MIITLCPAPTSMGFIRSQLLAVSGERVMTQNRPRSAWRNAALSQMPKAVGSESLRPSAEPLGLSQEPPAAT